MNEPSEVRSLGEDLEFWNWIAPFYDSVYTGLEGDVEFYVSLSRDRDWVLDIGCGTGRIAIPVVKQGSKVVCLDFSRKIIQIAKSKARVESADSQIGFVRCDMKKFRLNKRFDLIIVPYRTFLALVSLEEQKRTLRNIREHLTDEGLFVFNVFVPNLRLIASYVPRWRLYRECFDEKEESLKIYEIRRYYPIDQIIEMRMKAIKYSEKKKTEQRDLTLKFRYFHRFELVHLLENCGFEVLEILGDFEKNRLDEKSTEMIWISKKH